MLRSVDSGRTWRWSAFGLHLHPFDSGELMRVFVSPTFARDATVYVHNVDGISKSIDGGNVWQLLPGSPVSQFGFDNLVFAPWYSTEATFAVAGKLGNATDVFLSRDAGATYERTNCPAVAPLAMLWTAAGLLVSGAAGGLYVSQQHGNWSPLPTANFTATHAVQTRATPGQTRVLFGGTSDVVHITLCRTPELHVCNHTSYSSAIHGTSCPPPPSRVPAP